MTDALVKADVKLKAGLVPLTTLSFSEPDIESIRNVLSQKKNEAPALFNNLPCVLDLAGLSAEQLNLAELKQVCIDCGLLPVAVKNTTQQWLHQTNALQLADLGKGLSKQTKPAQPENTDKNQPVIEEKGQRAVKVHSTNVRSGQQLYFDGDLFVLGMVSAGAEVLATGDIHISGALRGRALAGAKGDEAAVISAQQFEAELVAIAGNYRLFEDEHEQHKQAVVIQLSDGNLNITGVS